MFSGTGMSGRGSASSMEKPPPYNVHVSKPPTEIDINTVAKPAMTRKAKVLYDYDATEADELSLLADEVGLVTIIVKLNSCQIG